MAEILACKSKIEALYSVLLCRCGSVQVIHVWHSRVRRWVRIDKEGVL